MLNLQRDKLAQDTNVKCKITDLIEAAAAAGHKENRYLLKKVYSVSGENKLRWLKAIILFRRNCNKQGLDDLIKMQLP